MLEGFITVTNKATVLLNGVLRLQMVIELLLVLAHLVAARLRTLEAFGDHFQWCIGLSYCHSRLLGLALATFRGNLFERNSISTGS